MTSQSIADTVVHVTKLIAGTKKRFPTGSQVLSFGGGTHTVDEVTGALQAFVDHRTAAPALLALLGEYTKFLRSTFGTGADVLGDFDLAPPKVPAPRTTAEKAVSAAKGKATRQARGTSSAKQKKAVKGNVTATLVVTPVASAPLPAPVTEVAPVAAIPAATPKV
jgi:hypothetical protein